MIDRIKAKKKKQKQNNAKLYQFIEMENYFDVLDRVDPLNRPPNCLIGLIITKRHTENCTYGRRR